MKIWLVSGTSTGMVHLYSITAPWSLSSPNSTTWAFSHLSLGFQRGAKVGKPQCVSTSQTSACVVFANVPLAKEMATPSFKGWRNGLHLLMGEVEESHWKGGIYFDVNGQRRPSRLLSSAWDVDIWKKHSSHSYNKKKIWAIYKIITFLELIKELRP